MKGTFKKVPASSHQDSYLDPTVSKGMGLRMEGCPVLSSAPRQRQEGNSRHFVPVDSLEGRLELSIYTRVGTQSRSHHHPRSFPPPPTASSTVRNLSLLRAFSQTLLGPLPRQCLHLHFSISSADDRTASLVLCLPSLPRRESHTSTVVA